MEEKNMIMNEVEAIEDVNEVEETSGSNTGSLIAGIVGGFLAYAIIGGAKKLKTVIDAKRAAKKELEAANSEDAANGDPDEDQSES